MAKPRRSDRQRYWREVIERQQASGQRIFGFCSQEGLAPASFHAWKRRLRPRRGTERTSVKQALVPVEIADDAVGAWDGYTGGLASRLDAKTVRLPVDARLRIPQ